MQLENITQVRKFADSLTNMNQDTGLKTTLVELTDYMSILKELGIDKIKTILEKNFETEKPFFWNNYNYNRQEENMIKDIQQCKDLLYYSLLLNDKKFMNKWIENANLAYDTRFYVEYFTRESIQTENNTLLKDCYAHLIELLSLKANNVEQEASSEAGESFQQGSSETQKLSKAFQRTKRPFDLEAWDADMKMLALGASEIPVLPPEAFTRESIYGNHD